MPLVFICAVLSVFLAKPGTCPPLVSDRPDHLEAHRGRFTYRHYGYSVNIPSNLVGYSDPPPLPSHGFDVWLSRHHRESKLYVLAFEKPNATSMQEIEEDWS